MQILNQTTIAKYSMPGSRGLSFGYNYLAIFGIGALGASSVGLALTYATVEVMFVVLAVFSFLSTALALFLVSR